MTNTDENWKCVPFAHQWDIYLRSRDLASFGLWLEMGLGKSAIGIANAAYLFRQGKINGMLVVAPNAVAPNWVLDELPRHLAVPARTFLWETKKATNKSYQDLLADWLETPGDELAILVMSYDAVMTQRRNAKQPLKGRDAVWEMLQSRRCLFVLDESARIKNPGAKRTKRLLAASIHAPYRRVMTGTPVSNSPFDVHTQARFLDPAVWDDIGCRNFQAFKTYFGIWEKFVRTDTGRAFETLVSYRNLGVLKEKVAAIGSRLLKTDVLDLPPKLYQKRFFDLSPEQSRLYRDLRRDFMLLLGDDMVTAPLAIVRMTRLQQITSGFLPIDPEMTGEQHVLEVTPNPRIQCLREVVEDIHTPFIVWCKYQREIDAVMELMEDMEIPACQYDGRTPSEEREEARVGFREGRFRAFVANPACAGEGLTLTSAKTVVYLSNSFKLADRLQSEDRAHRIGADQAVTYVDIVARGTIDHYIVRALREKLEYAQCVTGDDAHEWI